MEKSIILCRAKTVREDKLDKIRIFEPGNVFSAHIFKLSLKDKLGNRPFARFLLLGHGVNQCGHFLKAVVKTLEHGLCAVQLRALAVQLMSILGE
jgi:hypothetical protein